ncbi:MAG: radical SAM protein [Thermoleophilia bacterium]
MGRTDGLYSAVQRQVINQMLKLAASDDKAKIVKAFQLAEKITPEQYKSSVRFVTEKVKDDHPALLISRHITSKLSPRCRDRFIECLIVNTLLRGVAKRKEFIDATGKFAPTTILMSPTMRCNLTCEGCYAAEYAPDRDLDRALLQKIVDEGNDMGVYLFTMLGGEPFLYDDLLDFARANKDSYFQVFTNGTLLDDDTIDELAEVGNIAPMLSLEGSPELTDRRRGRGVYAQVMHIMDRLGEAGVLFGYSCTVARNSWRAIVSDEFVDPLIAKGAVLSWHFLYMPVGRDPDTRLMLTPGERNQFRVDIRRIRDTKPMFPVDFWGDAPWVNGCIAGKHYMHINSEGWVEPCIFTHFATDNIREVSLLEAFNSPFFEEIRRRQPFNHNLLMPCMWIDNPAQSREIMAATGARPTHPGGDVMLTDLQAELDLYSAEVERVYNPIWDCMCGGRDEAEESVEAPVS